MFYIPRDYQYLYSWIIYSTLHLAFGNLCNIFLDTPTLEQTSVHYQYTSLMHAPYAGYLGAWKVTGSSTHVGEFQVPISEIH